ncbi:MAG: MBL fold metallo-hydrolase [Acidimicrobiia bacterium]|jgi:glyoxylase-like metal-dependent hydrolase (beta-lactamase superfamily II)
MTALALVTRRMLLKDMGKAGLAVLVLGAAACSDEGSEDSSTSTGSEPSTSEASDASTTPAPTTTSPQANGAYEWQRVNLGFVSAYILYRGGEATIVDTGVEGSEDSIKTALGEVGLGWSDVSRLIVTHKHPDHQGSVEAVLAASGADWYAGAGDIEAITATTEGTVVGDGDDVGGLQVIETPGHTPGHISVLDSMAGVLASGDALNGSDGGVIGANPDFSEDMTLANASVAKLATFDYEVALFGHGEPVLSEASDAVAALAATL